MHIMNTQELKKIFKATSIPVVVASLCCLSPLILLSFGLATVSFASSLADVLYGEYKWVFRGAGLLLLIISIILYVRRERGICTIDEAKKHYQELINITLLFLSVGILGYLFFLYVVVHYVGVFLGVWP